MGIWSRCSCRRSYQSESFGEVGGVNCCANCWPEGGTSTTLYDLIGEMLLWALLAFTDESVDCVDLVDWVLARRGGSEGAEICMIGTLLGDTLTSGSGVMLVEVMDAEGHCIGEDSGLTAGAGGVLVVVFVVTDVYG